MVMMIIVMKMKMVIKRNQYSVVETTMMTQTLIRISKLKTLFINLYLLFSTILIIHVLFNKPHFKNPRSKLQFSNTMFIFQEVGTLRRYYLK
jgi:hypothetical protein